MFPRLNRTLFCIIVGFALSLSAARLSAQAAWTAPIASWGSYWCPTCYVAMNIDTPNLEAAYAGSIQGWAFECGSGQPVDRVDVYYKNDSGLTRAKAYLAATNIARPDVAQHFTSYCPAVSGTTGFSIGFTEPIPAGTWTISVVAWKGSISSTQTGVVVIP